MSSHPALETLALYSSSDLPWKVRWQVGYHIARCAECEHQVALFRSATEELRREASSQTLTGYEAIADWTQLEREMLGNIAVGVAAARCIDNVGRKRSFVWRSALAAGLAILFVVGWMTHVPREETEHLAETIRQFVGFTHPEPVDTIVRSTPVGIAVRTQGATLTILHPPSAVISLSGNAGVEARYIDEQTGQVTITDVYGQ